jgi:hypothetical protein
LVLYESNITLVRFTSHVHFKKMSKRLKFTILILSAFILFLVGMGVAHFKLFPYTQIIDLRTSPLLDPVKNLIRESADTPESRPAYIKNTALQRLLVKEISFERFPASSSTYLTETNGTLHLVSTHGEFTSYNFDSATRTESSLPPVPMNYELLQSSPLVGVSGFAESHFRVLGVHSEPTGNGNGHIYVTHHYYEPEDDCVSFVLSRIEVNNASASGGWERLFEGTPCMRTMIGSEGGSQRFHIRLTTGGAMTSVDGNMLLFTVGDHGFDGIIHESLRDIPASMFGKIYQINKTTGETSIFAEGFRNTQGLVVDGSGTIWGTDHGPYGGDELNVIRENLDYGWPNVTYGIEYGYQPWPHSPDQGNHEGYEKPEFVWMNAVAPTDLLFIEPGETFKNWSGDLLTGSLLAQSLFRIRLDADGSVMYSEQIEIGHRIRSMETLSDGSIAIMTDDRTLFIIADGGPVYEPMSEQHQANLEGLNKYDRLLE